MDTAPCSTSRRCTLENRGILLADGRNTALRFIPDNVYTHGAWRKVRLDVQAQGLTAFVNGVQKLTWSASILFPGSACG